MPTTKEDIEQLIIEANIEAAIQELLKGAKINGQKDLYNGLILLSSRFNSNEDGMIKGILNKQEYDLEKTRITNSLQYYLDKYKPSSSNDKTDDVTFTPRKVQLEKQLADYYRLLGDYENSLITETDPRTKMKYEKEIVEIKKRISDIGQEMKNL